MPAKPVPAISVKPEVDRSYLCYCPDHGGWHVGEWWTIDGPGRWVLAMDAATELHVSHVLDVPADAMDVSETLRWITTSQVRTAGSA